MARYNSKYNKMTTIELEQVIENIEKLLKPLIEQKNELLQTINVNKSLLRYLKNKMYNRKHSKYNGEYYINSDFRKQYEKPFRELPAKKKKEYMARYFKENKEEIDKRRKRRKNKDGNDRKTI